MLRLFRKKNKKLDPQEVTKLDSVDWPFWSVLSLRLRPFQGRRFFNGIISMTAKMAAVDGAISQPELKLFLDLLETHFSLTSAQKKSARKVLFHVQHSRKSFSDLAKEFFLRFKNQRALIENAFDVLLSMAYVDNILTKSEQILLSEAAIIFQLSPRTISRLTARHHNWKTKIEGAPTQQEKEKEFHQNAEQNQRESEKAKYDQQSKQRQENYKKSENNKSNQSRHKPLSDLAWALALGVDASDSTSSIKRKYRQLVRQYHPDVLPKDIPSHMLKASNERFLDIQKAYEVFCKDRGIKG
jgi:DnaJ like chaperone protein